MEKKLTIRMDERLILRAKRLARGRGTSLSRLVADCLSALEATGGGGTVEPTPRASALRGALGGAKRGGGDGGGGRRA